MAKDETYGTATDGAHVEKVNLEGPEEEWTTDAANAKKPKPESEETHEGTSSIDQLQPKTEKGKENLFNKEAKAEKVDHTPKQEAPIDYKKL